MSFRNFGLGFLSNKADIPESTNGRVNFSADIRNINLRTQMLQHEMMEFSQELQKAMRLKNEEVNQMEKNLTKWKIGDYIVGANNFCYENGWFKLLFAVPYDKFKNENEWIIVYKGTASIFLPSRTEQEKIIAVIEDVQSDETVFDVEVVAKRLDDIPSIAEHRLATYKI